MNFNKGKALATNNNNTCSEEDEPSFTEDGNVEEFHGVKGKKGSPWQRMKWTDDVVRLLIAVVACVGDDGTLEGMEGVKRKSGVLQKKGKWKMVSKIMINKSCYVSPQQCEDKFNDLNKRYKRLNEILGRGTTWRVVENPRLLDSMTHLSPKMKDDVRKILNSRHLFYKEMCAYHNGQVMPNCQDFGLQCYSLPTVRCSKENNGSEEEEAKENEECEYDELDNEDANSGEEDRKTMAEEDFHYQAGLDVLFGTELDKIFQDPTKPHWERREWVRNSMLQLHEQRVSIQAQSFELEQRHFKWVRFCNKKDMELERLRLENQSMKLENERMAFILKQKEIELDLKKAEASFKIHNWD